MTKSGKSKLNCKNTKKQAVNLQKSLIKHFFNLFMCVNKGIEE